MQFYIADTHFFHADLLGQNDFAPRLFANVTDMNNAMIKAWNDRVDDNDVVYHLGDIAMNPEQVPTNEQTAAILEQLNGRIVFIKGNHDYRALFKYLAAHDPMPGGTPKYQFHDVGAIVKDNHTQLFLTHYPLLMGIVKQTLNIHGHIHHSMVPVAENINVGVDAPERDLLPEPLPFGAPLTAAEIFTIFEKKRAYLASVNDTH
ncbi:metallophosphoesterase [Lacticaseibacillus saniviri]|uniref:Phosphoesterase n=1 Tax=Lacticaseibacillus saniviri JCM 17471 = DSM 24301 TaxID=1293598 RepID=A0A0R2MWQ2_9LACO|nr:metallophosphoesterase [Lacticaseibacillus saniviri]KRO17937.1 phosphoesterase [Lacticaseibacillus saniviri JCM 17471 = DSM 24301]MCG4281721.1 metallophosphoesterase family protein [Lacticaseibacillus saniviri]